MKSVSNDYKEQLTALGRQYKVLVTYTQNNQQVELSNSELNIVTPHYEGDLLKSVMKQLDLDSNVDIPIGTEINCQFGLLVGNNYEYIDYGNYIVYSSEKQEDLKSYKIVCYDKMLNAMKDYERLTTRNLFDKLATPQNTSNYIASTGQLVSNNEFGVYKLFVKPNTKYTLTNSGGSNAPGLCYYNNSDTYISGFNYGNRATITFTTPANTSYVLFSVVTLDTSSRYDLQYFQLEEGETATTYTYHFVEYPISVKNYLELVAFNFGLSLATQTFVNDDVEISSEKYLDENGNTLGYTYRDVLDELAQATASTICINEDNELEIKYVESNFTKNYKPIEYIKSTGTQYIDTGFKPNQDTRVVLDFSNQTTSDGWILGARINYNDSNYSILSWASGYLRTDYYNGGLDIGIARDTRYLIDKDKNITTAYRNGTQINKITQGYATFTPNLNMYLFALNNNGSVSNKTKFTLYSCKIYDNGNLIRDFVPCIRKNDNEIGLYDLVNDVFCGNLGTGNFVAGEETTETFDETYLKDTNVNFKEKYGPINSVVFSRSGDSDLIYRKDDESIEENGLCELKIKDNQLLNGNDRDNFIDEIYNQLNGLEYYVNDYTSTGITILELCDKYNVKVGENIYPCVMFNDELNVTQGFDEMIHTDKPETNESDYKKADTTDRRINQAYIIVDKQKQEIEALTDRTDNLETLEGNDKQELLAKFGDYALDSKVNSLTTQVQTIQTDTYTRTQVKQILKGTFYDENNNQVVSEVVKTISGTFDENGMTYAKTNAKTSTTINEIGVRVNNTTSNDELLFAGYDDSISQTIVRTDNIVVRNYINIGTYSRLQDYETGTGVFDI